MEYLAFDFSKERKTAVLRRTNLLFGALASFSR
jgi:hypothetical protein